MDITYDLSLGAMMVGPIELIIILFVAMVMLGLPSLVLWLVLRKNKGGSGMANCGKCGYQVRGISTLNCPECGADLREVGIVKGKSSKVMVWVAVVVGVGVVLIGLCACSGFVFYRAKSVSAPMTAPVGPPKGPIVTPPTQTQPIPDKTDSPPEDAPGAAQSPGQK